MARDFGYLIAFVIMVGIPIWLVMTVVEWFTALPSAVRWLIVVAVIGICYAAIRARISAARARREYWAEQARIQAELDRQVATTDYMTGTEFEHLVARLLVRDGWQQVAVQGGANDLGADVTAYDGTGRKLVVQCKRYGQKLVGSPEIQKFAGTQTYHRAHVSLFVTTSGFTQPAVSFATTQGIVLVDRSALARWMTSGPAPAFSPRATAPRPAPSSANGASTATVSEGSRPSLPVSPAPVRRGDAPPPALRPADPGPIPELTWSEDFDHISVVISRDAIEDRNLDEALNVLGPLVVDTATARRFCGSVDVGVDGYNHDPREIYEIPEVRAYIRDLDEEFPFLPFFISRRTGTLKMLAFCLIPSERVAAGQIRIDRRAYAALVERWHEAVHFTATEVAGFDKGAIEALKKEFRGYFSALPAS